MLQLRTRNLLDQVAQDRMALRMKRASIQTNLTTKLIKETATYERLCVSDNYHVVVLCSFISLLGSGYH